MYIWGTHFRLTDRKSQASKRPPILKALHSWRGSSDSPTSAGIRRRSGYDIIFAQFSRAGSQRDAALSATCAAWRKSGLIAAVLPNGLFGPAACQKQASRFCSSEACYGCSVFEGTLHADFRALGDGASVISGPPLFSHVEFSSPGVDFDFGIIFLRLSLAAFAFWSSDTSHAFQEDPWIQVFSAYETKPT